MKIHCIKGPPSPEMARSLARFEREFRYPLGPSESFSISHGADYPRFFRSIGEANIYLAESHGNIIGSLATVQRTVRLADGTEVLAAYLADAKVTKNFRGGMVLGRLAMAARDAILGSGCDAGFCVVMSGSSPSDRFTGRLGIPKFEELGKLAILRFDTTKTLKEISHCERFEETTCHRAICGQPSIVSSFPPETLTVAGASGTLVDTRCGKRLWKSDGAEMISSHLTELHFTSDRSLCQLINSASAKSRKLGFPGLFTALPAEHPSVKSLLKAADGAVEIAGASVYGTGLPIGDWIINTSEI